MAFESPRSFGNSLFVLNYDFALISKLDVLNPSGHLLLILLELVEVVQIVKHSGNQEREVADNQEVRMTALIILKHNQAVMVSLLPLEDSRVSLRNSLVGICLVLLRHSVTLCRGPIIVGFRVLILQCLIRHKDFLFFLVGVKCDQYPHNRREHNQKRVHKRDKHAVLELRSLDQKSLNSRMLPQISGHLIDIIIAALLVQVVSHL